MLRNKLIYFLLLLGSILMCCHCRRDSLFSVTDDVLRNRPSGYSSELGNNYRFRILEESANGTEILGVADYLKNQVNIRHHTDPSASERRTSYQLLDSHEMLTRLLQVEPQTGRLLVEGRIDRENLCPQVSNLQPIGFLHGGSHINACIKRLNVLATVAVENQKGVEMITIPLELIIDDINDNPPAWSAVIKRHTTETMDALNYPILDTTVLEQVANSEFVSSRIDVSAAFDPDFGINGEISYELRNFDPPSDLGSEEPDKPVPFKINDVVNSIIQLIPLQPIDYEKQSVYDLLLVATDKGSPQQTGYAHVKIHVIDVNDESPVFTQKIFLPPRGGVSERMPPGTVLLNVTATDADASDANSHLRYSLVPSNNHLIAKYFSVHPDGRILLHHWLDYETLEPAHMSSSPSAARAAPPSNGKQFSFYVQAIDSAPSPYERTGTALVVVPIIDENDEAPIISSRFLGPPELVRHGEAGVITENSSVPVRLAYIQARDPDFNGHDRVDCTVLDNTNLSLKSFTETDESKDSSAFKMGESIPVNNDFLLSLESTVDREATQMLVARIHCVDEAANPSDKLIRIRVLDVNDEAPSFLWPTYYFSVKENREVGAGGRSSENVTTNYRIGRVVAYDRDQGDNAKILYSILPQMEITQPIGRPSFFPQPETPRDFSSLKTADLFEIDSFTGEVFAKRPFDAEQVESIKFRVIAADQPTDPEAISHTGTASVHVRIIDVNDWSPLFYMTNGETDNQGFRLEESEGLNLVDSYVFSIPENRPTYTFVGRIGAVDPDVSFWSISNGTLDSSKSKSPLSSRILLQFTPDTPATVKDALSVHTATGQIRTVRPLDREMHANYTFQVLAIDKGQEDGLSRTSTASVMVLIEDENDNDPVFIRPATDEGSTVPSQVEPMGNTATARIGLAITSGHLPENLPRQANEELGIAKSVASTPGGHSRHHPPDKDQIQVVAVHRVSVASMMEAGDGVKTPNGGGNGGASSDSNGRPLIRVEAHDPDNGLNGEIRYSIGSGDTDNLFYLDPISGSLILKSSAAISEPSVHDDRINSESDLSYLLRLEACDLGSPRRCAVPVWLRMVMDNPSPIGALGFQKQWADLGESNIPYSHLGSQTYAGGSPGVSGSNDGAYSRDVGGTGESSRGDKTQAGYPNTASGGRWPTYADRWSHPGSLIKQNEYGKDWRQRARGMHSGSYASGNDFGLDERQFDARRGSVSASEAVIICLAVIFAILLCAALILVYLVKRRSIYFSIAGRHKSKPSEEAQTPEYIGGNFKNEVSTTCEGLDPSEKASLYRMVADTRAPGKIVFVDNNFDRQSLPGGATPDDLALSPIVDGKRISMQDVQLRRGLSASAAVLTNLDSVYISPSAESMMGASEYPEVMSRCAFNYGIPHCETTGQFAETDHNRTHPMVFGTIVGPRGTPHPVSYTATAGYANPCTLGEYVATSDAATLHRRCASLKPRPVAMSSPYRFIQAPPLSGSYIYGSAINSPSRTMHFRGISEPAAANNQVPYSPHRSFACPEDMHTYHDIDLLAATLQRQRRLEPTLEQVAEVAQPDCQISSPYKRLRQVSYAGANRYATLANRMAPDGEVTALMDPMTIKRQRMHQETLQQMARDHVVMNTADFDGQTSRSPNSLIDAFIDADEVESVTDPNAKLISSVIDDQTLTTRKCKLVVNEQGTEGADQSTSTTDEKATKFVTTKSSTLNSIAPTTSSAAVNVATQPSYAVHAYHETSFV